jgi:branched-chain amino acid transport system permease protein
MIYQATHHVNFAQGAMAMFSTYIAWALIDAGVPYWAAFGLTLLFSFLAGVAIERIIIRPVERGPALTIVIVFVGLLLILNSLAGWTFSYTIKTLPSPFPSTPWYDSKYLSPHEVGMIAVTLAVLILVFLFNDQRGVSCRKINFISPYYGYSPSKTLRTDTPAD